MSISRTKGKKDRNKVTALKYQIHFCGSLNCCLLFSIKQNHDNLVKVFKRRSKIRLLAIKRSQARRVCPSLWIIITNVERIDTY